MKRIILVYRAPVFSPNSVNKDKAILEAVGGLLGERGYDVEYIHEEDLMAEHDGDLFLTMGRLPETLAILAQKEKDGCIVLNTTKGVRLATSRLLIDRMMRENDIPTASLCDGPCCERGYWLKRGDAAAQSLDDVQYAQTWDDVERKLVHFHNRGISDVLVCEHIEGDVVKFYGVQGTDFFRIFYPTDDGQMKFGDEVRNGEAHHYPFDAAQLQNDANRLSQLAELPVYGGDCIVRPDGSYAVIDFNDWPSFARCRDEAAGAIASLVNATSDSQPNLHSPMGEKGRTGEVIVKSEE